MKKNISKKMLSLIVILSMVLSYFLPVVKVFAYESITDNISIGFKDNYNTVQGYVEYSVDDGGHWVKVEGALNNQAITMAGDNLKVRIIANSGYMIDWAGIEYSESNDGENYTNYNLSLEANAPIAGALGGQNGYQVNSSVKSVRLNNVEFRKDDNQGGGFGGPGSNFDGRAYVVWSCQDGGVCYHYFSNIPVNADGTSVFYKTTEVTDDNTGEAFRVDAEYKGWYLADTFTAWVNFYKSVKGITGDVDWSSVDPKDIVGDSIDMSQYESEATECSRDTMAIDEFESCVNAYAASQGVILPAKLQPLRDEPTDNNAYVSYGDRNFKVVIFNDSFKAVSIGDLDDLNYYPAAWKNPFTRQDQFDLSGTSKSNPTDINTVLLESTINIKTLNYNSFNISSIEALDVPTNAVSVSKVNGEFRIVFSSNFYDQVVFKVTDNNGNTEYMRINRYTVDAGINRSASKVDVSADVYYDKNNSYTDFVVNAKVLYKDGTSKIVEMTNSGKIDDGLGNYTLTKEYNEETDDPGHLVGKGLKRSNYVYSISTDDIENVSKVFINVEYRGSTSTNYAGAFSGSGDGVVVDLGGVA